MLAVVSLHLHRKMSCLFNGTLIKQCTNDDQIYPGNVFISASLLSYVDFGQFAKQLAKCCEVSQSTAFDSPTVFTVVEVRSVSEVEHTMKMAFNIRVKYNMQ